MKLIMEIWFGSNLYGTATPQSDLDFKAVYIPNARNTLLQRVRDNIGISPDKEPGARNSPGDVDREIFSLQRYLSLLAEGQTMALDMLFAPDSAMTMAPAPLWREVQMNAHRLVTRRASAFLRYCRQQANKYGIKGSRIAVARQVLAVLESAEAAYGTTAKLAVAVRLLESSWPSSPDAKSRSTTSSKFLRFITFTTIRFFSKKKRPEDRDDWTSWTKRAGS